MGASPRRPSPRITGGGGGGSTVSSGNGAGLRKARRRKSSISRGTYSRSRILPVVLLIAGVTVIAVIVLVSRTGGGSNYNTKVTSYTDNDKNGGSTSTSRNLLRPTGTAITDGGGVTPRKKKKKKKSKAELLALPQNQFPVGVGTQETNPSGWETILHPAEEAMVLMKGESVTDDVRQMSVPKFWQPPSNFPVDGTLITRSQASSIGSHISPPVRVKNPSTYRVKDTIDHIDIDVNPFDDDGLLETIFVMIASYRDDQCIHTVESIMGRAHFPERVRIAIVDQRDGSIKDEPTCNEPLESCDVDPHQALCLFRNQIDYYEMEARYGVGPVFARHVGYRMYRGEYFAMQVDAHVFFVDNWDAMLVDQFKRTSNEMAVMTTYLSDVVGAIDPDTHKSLHEGRPIMCNTDFESDGRSHMYLRNEQQPEAWPQIKRTPQLAPYWAAGFSFARGHFLVQVPYDQYLPMIFQGEEINIGLRGFTFGYDYYAPEFGVCFHMYANGINKAKRNKIKMFWENGSSYKGVDNHSYDRLLGLIQMNQPDVPDDRWNHAESQKYSIGKVRKVQKFLDVFGIHLNEQTVEHHLCRFVQNKMHTMFVQHLRPNGMGIDYDRINYRFIDPDPQHPED